MKVAYLIPEWPGQSHVWTWREISHLRELGLEVEIFSTRHPQQLNRSNHAFAITPEAAAFYLWPMSLPQMILSLLWAIGCHPKGVLSCLWLSFRLPLYQQPAWRSILPLILPACLLAKEIKRRNIEHIHTPMPANSAILCMMVKRLVNVPFSLAIVAHFTHWGGAMPEKIVEAEFIALVSQWMVKQTQQDFPWPSPARYGLAQHGVDIRKWIPKPRISALESDSKRIFSVGRLVQGKGFDVLLAAIAIVKHRGLSFQLEIAGEGSERAALEMLIQQLGLQHEVTLLGSICEDECLEKMQSAELFVLATRDEALGVVFLEAMAIKVATIGTAVGGVMNIIQDGVNGLLVPPDSVEELADAIETLLVNDALREKLGKAGRQTVLQKFDSRDGAGVLRTMLLNTQKSVEDWSAEPVNLT